MLSPWTPECPCRGLPETTLSTTIGCDGLDSETDTLSQKVANEVIKGEWGNGEARKKMLTEYGYDWRHIQNLVNEKLGNPVRHLTPKFKIFKGGMNHDKK